MKTAVGFAILVAGLISLGPRPALAQACQDEEEMVKTSSKDIGDLIDSVKKENVTEFQNHYHQKSYLSKMSFLQSVVGGLVDCLGKAEQDTTATKEQADAYKAKHEAYAKLKSKLEQERSAVKSADDPKNAKTLVEKSDLST